MVDMTSYPSRRTTQIFERPLVVFIAEKKTTTPEGATPPVLAIALNSRVFTSTGAHQPVDVAMIVHRPILLVIYWK